MSDVGRIGDAPAAGDPAAAESAAVTRFLDDLRGLGEGPAPEPSPELAALLAGVPTLSAARSRRPRILRRVALIAAAVVAGTTLAAANHRLPAPAQRVVSNVVNDLTPFHIDTPHPAPPPASTTPVPTSPPPTHAVPVPVRPSEDSSEPSDPGTSGERGGGGSGETSDATAPGSEDDRGSSSAPIPSRTSDTGGDGGESSGGSGGGSDGGSDGGADRSAGPDGGGD